MTEYFNNRPFLESIPGNINTTGNSKNNTAMYIILAIAGGALLGFIIQQAINKKTISKLVIENEELKNKKV